MPTVLILGGCGFVGRHLVYKLVKEELCGKIRVVDKRPPSMANLSPEQKAAFDSSAVEFKQADLSRQTGVDKAFVGVEFTHVFNLTFDAVKFGEADEVSIRDVALMIAEAMEIDMKQVKFDTSKADGQYKKTACNDKLMKLRPDFKFTPMKEGIKKSVDWFVANYETARK